MASKKNRAGAVVNRHQLELKKLIQLIDRKEYEKCRVIENNIGRLWTFGKEST